jgi:hypothetical protein
LTDVTQQQDSQQDSQQLNIAGKGSNGQCCNATALDKQQPQKCECKLIGV